MEYGSYRKKMPLFSGSCANEALCPLFSTSQLFHVWIEFFLGKVLQTPQNLFLNLRKLMLNYENIIETWNLSVESRFSIINGNTFKNPGLTKSWGCQLTSTLEGYCGSTCKHSILQISHVDTFPFFITHMTNSHLVNVREAVPLLHIRRKQRTVHHQLPVPLLSARKLYWVLHRLQSCQDL